MTAPDLAAAPVGGRLRPSIVAAAARITGEAGWAAVTMARLAQEIGVSRQTVYNEVGSKPRLAEAVVLDALARFLATVDAAFDAHPRSLHAAVHDAVRGVLELAESDALLRAVVSATYGGDTELLPHLTTNATPVLDTAKAVVSQRITPYVGVDDLTLASCVDVLVRVVLSHVMAPSGTPAATASALATAVDRLLR